MTTDTRHDIVDGEFDLDKIKSLETFDVADHLDTPELLAAYLTECFAESDPALITEALRTASRSTGMTRVAERSGLARESLYKALRPGSQPRLETILNVLRALGMQLRVQPIGDQSEVTDPAPEESSI